jgi:hypothetical protein
MQIEPHTLHGTTTLTDFRASMSYQFTPEDRQRGGRARRDVLPPQQRQRLATRAAYRRWYRVTDEDADRIDRHLKMLSKIAAIALADEDHPLAVRAIVAMAPFERMKIMLHSGLKDVIQLENSSDIETKLAAARERRSKAIAGEEATVMDNRV